MEDYNLSITGTLTPTHHIIRPKQVSKFDGIYKYSGNVFRRIRKAELAVKAFAALRGLRCDMLTLTFPVGFDNVQRFAVNDRFRKNVRMAFPDGGMWVTEAHTEEKTKGLYHFHYYVITGKPKGTVLNWLRAQQHTDGVERNSYDYSSEKSEGSVYLSLYQSKEYQKSVVTHTGRIWAMWGKIDYSSIQVSEADFLNLNVSCAIVSNKRYYLTSKLPSVPLLVLKENLKKKE